MKLLFRICGLLTLGLIFWAALAYLMDKPSFSYVRWLLLASILFYLIAGILKNRSEKRAFQEFLLEKQRDKKVQEKLQDERIEPGDKTGRAGVKAKYRDRNSGVDWMPANVHGAVPARKKRRSFLPKNR
jgi:hypothetical protein